jgi:hypothetical protein
MLSLSADSSKQEVDLKVINGEGDGGVPLGGELVKFAEAVASGDGPGNAVALQTCREALLAAAGSDVLVDAAAVAGNFQRMVRIADATGIPLDPIVGSLGNPVQDALDLHRFPSAQHTPALPWLQKIMGIPLRFLAPFLMRAPRKTPGKG